MKLIGWRLVGTDKWCPLWMGPPPEAPGLRWEPIYRHTDLYGEQA